MKLNALLVVLAIFTLFVVADAKSQIHPQPFPDPQVINPPDDWLLQLFLNNKFRIGGVETGVSTYGYSIGAPVLWAGDQLKIVPVLSWFWQTPSRWSSQGVLGGKVLYFINKQQGLSKGDMNPYMSGFSIIEGDGRHNRHNSGIAIGVQPHFSRFIKLGFELQAGLRSDNGEDHGFGGAAITIGFGWK